MNKRIFLGGAVLLGGMLLSGCALLPQSTTSAPQAEVNVTLSGSLSQGAGGIYLLKTADRGIVQLHDAGAKLGGFVGQNISVTGQYSGTTLYVDKVTQ